MKRRTVLASLGMAAVPCAGCSSFDDAPDMEIAGDLLTFEAADRNGDGKLDDNVNRNDGERVDEYDTWEVEIALTITDSDTDNADFEVSMLGPILNEEQWGHDVSQGTTKTFRRTERDYIRDRVADRVNENIASDMSGEEVTAAFKNALSGEEISLTYPINDAENTTIATYQYPY